MVDPAQPYRSISTTTPRPMGRPNTRRARQLAPWCRRLTLVGLTALCPLILVGAEGVQPAKLVGPDKAAIGDAVGDLLDTSSTPVDLTRFVAERRGDVMRLELHFAASVSGADTGQDDALFGFIDLDTDQQSTTGELASVDFLSAFSSGLGSDVVVDLSTYSSVDRKMDVVALDGSGAVGQVANILGRAAATFEAQRLLLDIPIDWLGGDGTLSAAAAVGNDKAVTDVAPDGGFLATIDGDGGPVLLAGGRFQVDVTWRDFSGSSGVGTLVFQSDDSAVFWFFNASNWELMVKVIDGCAFNDRFWVFSAATTDVEFTVQITDTVTGAIQSYQNPLGVAAAAVTDTGAFATCGGV